MLLKFDEYVVGLREHKSNYLFNNKSAVKEFKFISKSFFWWYADPFVFEFNNKHYLFVERYNRLTCKGHIAVAEINNKKPSFKSCGNFSYHMSFPFVSVDESGIPYMIPETMNDKSISKYVFKEFPYKITKKNAFVIGSKNVDSSIINDNLLTYNLSNRERPVFELYKISNKGTKKTIEITDETFSLRGAGKAFAKEKGIIYPTQNCKESYGFGIYFNKVMFDQDFVIETFEKIDAIEVSKYLSKKIFGIHTYNCDSKYEVIDLTIKRFSILSFVGKAFNRLRNKLKKKLFNCFCK